MSKIVINGDVVLKRNNTTDAQGVAVPPKLESLEYGEIAINYNAKDACIFIKALDAAGQQKIVKFVGEEVIAKTLGDILGESAADLATLKEMIKLFEGSSSDVLTLVKNLQTEVALKATKTYVDTELGKKLGKAETAADSSKLGGILAADYARFYRNATNLDTITSVGSNFGLFTTGYQPAGTTLPGGNYAGGLNIRHFISESEKYANQLAFVAGNETPFIRSSNAIGQWSAWRQIWHSGNSNRNNEDWTADTLKANETLINGAACDAVHKLIINGSAKANYFRFASRTDSFASAGYIGCGSTLHDTVYLISNKDIAIGAGGSSNTIIIPESNEISLNRQTRIHSDQCSFSISDSRHSADGNILNGTVHCQLLFKKHTGVQIGGGIQLIQEGDRNLYAGALSFITNGGSGVSEKMRILGNGNVCIGANSGSEKLSVNGNIFGYNFITVGNGHGFRINDKDGNAKRCIVHDGNNDTFFGQVDTGVRDLYIRHNGYSVFKFTGTNTQRAFCFNNNKIGLFTDTPQADLDIRGAKIIIGSDGHGTEANPRNYDLAFRGNYGGDYARIRSIEQSGTSGHGTMQFFVRGAKGTATAEPDLVMTLDRGRGATFENNVAIKNNLRVLGETYTYSADGIETFESGGATRLADLADVDLSGVQDNFVLYQSTETNANGDRIWKARSDAKTWSDISGKPTTFTPVEHNHIGSTYVTTPSDRALKTDLRRIDLATNTILSLTPYTYNWTTQAIETFGFKNHHAAGVIAQEIESILPFAVQPLNDEFKAVDYIQIIPYLIAAFQELHSALQNKNIAITNATKEYKRMYGANEKLAKRVSGLENELNNLKNQIAA